MRIIGRINENMARNLDCPMFVPCHRRRTTEQRLQLSTP